MSTSKEASHDVDYLGIGVFSSIVRLVSVLAIKNTDCMSMYDRLYLHLD